jgi:lipoprotein-releasing system ATP-binding protein
MSNLIVAKGVHKTFQRKHEESVQVLSGVDFEIAEGDKIAILGKSGAGKSTLLHILGTLEHPTQGTVTYKGQDIFSLKEKDLASFRNRAIGFVFQFHYLMVEFTALDNVMMPALLSGMSVKEAREKARELLTKVGLQDRLTHKPGQLSGGEQQRVAIARALMMKPKLLLTDEMTGNLDPVTGQQIFDLIEKIHQEFGLALVSVTHDEALAARYPKSFRLDRGTIARV